MNPTEQPNKPEGELTENQLDEVAGGGVVNHEEQYRKPKEIVSPRDPLGPR